MRQPNPVVDPHALMIAARITQRVRQRKFGGKYDLTEALRCIRLTKADRAAVRNGGLPIVRQNTTAAQFFVEHCLEFIEGTHNERRKERATAALRLAFGTKTYEGILRRREWIAENSRRSLVDGFEREWDSHHKRGVYSRNELPLLFSVTSDGKYLTRRRVLPHENLEAVSGALWRELDEVDPTFGRLTLVH